jgi:hypothetical protein
MPERQANPDSIPGGTPTMIVSSAVAHGHFLRFISFLA